MRHNDVLHDEQKANLIYAFEKIKPVNHLEETIAVACAMSMQPVCKIVDEYARRRKGEAPRLPAHPVTMLKAWGVPNTYGMLIFREQIDALLAGIIGLHLGAGQYFRYRIICGEIKKADFVSKIREKYPCSNRDDIIAVYDAVLYYAPMGRPYIWCSSMVDRADALSKAQ